MQTLDMDIRVDRSGEKSPKSILTMFYGWENASGSAYIKGKNFEKNTPAKEGWHFRGIYFLLFWPKNPKNCCIIVTLVIRKVRFL